MKLSKTRILSLSLSAAFLIACGEKKFSAGVATGAIEKIPSADQKPQTKGTDDSLESETPKPTTEETFNECDTFSNTNIVADLYPTTEAEFHQNGQKPLATQAYGNPTKTFCMSNLDIPLRNFAEGFPGFPDLKSWFILDIRFVLEAPEAGLYSILIDSDDGSIVTVNEQELINVDGLRDGNQKIYEERTVELKKGANDIRVQYMQGPGPDLALMLKWKRPGQATAEVIPETFIKAAVR